MSQATQSFEDWCERHRAEFRTDPVWRMSAYRLASYAADVAWPDCVALDRNRITRPLAGQLLRALGSIAANISEGYSRSSGRDRARVYEYALGSAREAIVWYRCGRHVLGDAVVAERVALLLRIIHLLLRTLPNDRGRLIRPDDD